MAVKYVRDRDEASNPLDHRRPHTPPPPFVRLSMRTRLILIYAGVVAICLLGFYTQQQLDRRKGFPAQAYPGTARILGKEVRTDPDGGKRYILRLEVEVGPEKRISGEAEVPEAQWEGAHAEASIGVLYRVNRAETRVDILETSLQGPTDSEEKPTPIPPQ